MNPRNSFNPSSGMPPVVRNLLIANIALFVLMTVGESIPDFDFIQKLALFNWHSEYFKPWQLITHLFMHGSFMHIFFNMFALWMFGTVLEQYWGSKRFLIYFMITGIGAAFLHLFTSYMMLNDIRENMHFYQSHAGYRLFEWFTSQYLPGSYVDSGLNKFMVDWYYDMYNPQYIAESKRLVNEIYQMRMNIPTVGASGAVFGLLLAFGMLFPNTVLMLIFPPIPIKAKYFVIAYGAIELYLGLRNNVDDNVAHFAHLGGMLFGFLLIRYWKRNPNQMNSF